VANPDPLCHRPEDDRIPAVPRVHQLVPQLTSGRSDELEQIRRVHPGVPVEVGLVALAGGLHTPGYYCRRFGYHYPPPVLERIIRLLESPGTLPADPDYEARSESALSYLRGRVPDLWERLAALRDRTADEAR